MRFISALIGGMIGGLIGAGIWAGITYATNYEIGWIAWGVGFLVGVGVRMGAQEWDGAAPGILAVVLALLAVVGGKYAAASLMVSGIGADLAVKVTEADVKESMCFDIAKERMASVPPLQWPPGKNLETANSIADFPADVQQEVVKRWTALSPAEQVQRIADQKKQMEEIHKMLSGAIQGMAFQHSFGPMDILFFLLAAFTAFKLGSGAAGDED